MAEKSENQAASSSSSIGLCWKEADGTVVLHLRALGEDGTIGSAILRYPAEHPQYAEICSHVGPLSEGEEKPVAPWPD